MSFRNTLHKAAGVASEGWSLLTGALGEGGTPPARYPSGETFPF